MKTQIMAHSRERSSIYKCVRSKKRVLLFEHTQFQSYLFHSFIMPRLKSCLPFFKPRWTNGLLPRHLKSGSKIMYTQVIYNTRHIKVWITLSSLWQIRPWLHSWKCRPVALQDIHTQVFENYRSWSKQKHTASLKSSKGGEGNYLAFVEKNIHIRDDEWWLLHSVVVVFSK